jgi:hypothetical protein
VFFQVTSKAARWQGRCPVALKGLKRDEILKRPALTGRTHNKKGRPLPSRPITFFLDLPVKLMINLPHCQSLMPKGVPSRVTVDRGPSAVGGMQDEKK